MGREGGGHAGPPVAPGAERGDEQEKADGGAQGPGIARRKIGVGQPDLEVAHPLTRLLLVEPPKFGAWRDRNRPPWCRARRPAAGESGRCRAPAGGAPPCRRAGGCGVCRTRRRRRTLRRTGEAPARAAQPPSDGSTLNRAMAMNRPATPTAGQKAGQICSQASAPRASPNLKRGSSVPFIPLPLFKCRPARRFRELRSRPYDSSHAGTCSAASISSTVGRRRTTAWLDP